MALQFSKYEGLGNDFVIVAGSRAERDEAASRAVEICDRHLGVGADGVLLVEGGARPSMVVVNADGSIPEMCGNGLRCVALHLVRTGMVSGREFTVETGAGPHPCVVLDDDRVLVHMRPATLAPHTLPMETKAEAIDAPFEFSTGSVRLTGVSMGNPHAVTFDEIGEARYQVGPEVGSSSLFPEGVNVGFATMHATNDIELHVLERGAGWTEACGTGACACAVAAVESNRSKRGQPITVRLPGGAMEIVVGELSDPVLMTGPARHVFDGELTSRTGSPKP